ncbi:MAG: beta strand repeat-containing protein [Desulfatirhabdiaceae bacterium]
MSVNIHGNDVTVDGAYDGTDGVHASFIASNSSSSGNGKAGNVNIETDGLKVTGGGGISASTFGEGEGGDITIHATDVTVDGAYDGSDGVYPSLIVSQSSNGNGKAGNVEIKMDVLMVSNGGEISASTFGEGSGGDITIHGNDVTVDGAYDGSDGVSRSFIVCQSGYDASGKAGSVNVETDTLMVSNGGDISASTGGEGDGGDITIHATDVTVDGAYDGSDGVHMSYIACFQASAAGTGKAGSINIETDGLRVTNGGRISASTYGRGDGGDITIHSTDVSVDGAFGGSDVVYRSFIVCESGSDATGRAGSVDIETDGLRVTNGGSISASTFGGGDGGDITIRATDVTVDGAFDGSDGVYRSFIACQSGSDVTGKAGNIEIETDGLSVTNGGVISANTYGQGDGGDVFITANQFLSIDRGEISVEAEQTNSGSIIVATPDLKILNEGRISANVSGGSGQGGSISLEVDQLTLSGGSLVESNTAGSGSGGNIAVAADTSVTIMGKADESSGLFSTSTGAGAAGSIEVNTPSLTLSDSGEISTSTSGAGQGGSIGIDVDNLTLKANSVISSASTGTGNAGNITITVASQLESRDSTITTESLNADGGDITIDTGFLTWLIDSAVTATVGGGVATTGGNVKINSPYVILKDSQVIANAYEGKGGSIGITADTYLADWTSVVSASSTLGLSGQVDINAPLANLSGLLTPLTISFMDLSSLLADDCEARYKKGKMSSLKVKGRDAVPVQPGDMGGVPVLP